MASETTTTTQSDDQIAKKMKKHGWTRVSDFDGLLFECQLPHRVRKEMVKASRRSGMIAPLVRGMIQRITHTRRNTQECQD